MHSRTINRLARLIAHSQMIAHRVTLAVTNDHSENFATRHPRANPRLHARLRQTNLIARAIIGMNVGIGWHPSFVRAPTHFGRRNAFFVEAFNRPSVDKFIDALWLVCYLCVAFADVNHARAGQHRQTIKRFGS